MKKFISCLGAGRYISTDYYLSDPTHSCATPYIQRATIELLPEEEKPEQILILTTTMAEEKHWNIEGGLKDQLKESEKITHIPAPEASVHIPDGIDDQEKWQMFYTILNLLEEGDEVVADITHGFRFLPMLMVSVLNYAKIVKKIKVLNIYYGAYEAKDPKNNMTPILSMGLYDQLLDWSNATSTFLKYGNSDDFVRMANEDIKLQRLSYTSKEEHAKASEITKFADSLQTFTENVETCRGKAAARKNESKSIARAYEMLRKKLSLLVSKDNRLLAPLVPLLEIIQKETDLFRTDATDPGSQMVDTGMATVRWCIDRKKVSQAFTAMEETLMSYICKTFGNTERTEEKEYREFFAGSVLASAIAELSQSNFQLKEECKKILTEEEIVIIKDAYHFLGNGFTKVADDIQQTRNDINHFGIRETAQDSKKIIQKMKDLYQELLLSMEEIENGRRIRKNYAVILAPNYAQAEEYTRNHDVDATVEAEYGDLCIEGSLVTLAHHGSRSHNPAPCNTEHVPKLEEGRILVSHVDLDALGGILDIMGVKPEDKAFWQGAELIDVNGLHHIHELSQQVQDKLNAFYAWKDARPHNRHTEITDVTESIIAGYKALNEILDQTHPYHQKALEKGTAWEKNASSMVEAKLVKESPYVRCFETDGVFCSAAYYSPNLGQIIPATVVLNTKYRSITVAFADGGKTENAMQIVQSLWGPQAGGRAGIAGSPRNWDISPEDLTAEWEKCCEMVEEKMREGKE